MSNTDGARIKIHTIKFKQYNVCVDYEQIIYHLYIIFYTLTINE